MGLNYSSLFFTILRICLPELTFVKELAITFTPILKQKRREEGEEDSREVKENFHQFLSVDEFWRK